MTIRRLRLCYRQPLLLLFSAAVAVLASGCLWGVVRDASSGAPVGGATLRYADSTGQTGTITADANGMYYFDGSNGPVPAAGPVNFVVDAPGYEPATETRQVGLGGVQNFDLAPKPGTYSNAKWGFSIKFPEDWMVQEGDEAKGETGVVGVAPPENVNDEYPELCYVMPEELGPGMTLEMYFQLTLKSMKASAAAFKQLETGEANVNGRDARWAVFSTKESKTNVKWLMYGLINGERGYLVLCAAESTQFLNHRGEFEDIAGSLRIY
jgi:hypothetical protein